MAPWEGGLTLFVSMVHKCLCCICMLCYVHTTYSYKVVGIHDGNGGLIPQTLVGLWRQRDLATHACTWLHIFLLCSYLLGLHSYWALYLMRFSSSSCRSFMCQEKRKVASLKFGSLFMDFCYFMACWCNAPLPFVGATCEQSSELLTCPAICEGRTIFQHETPQVGTRLRLSLPSLSGSTSRFGF